MVFLHGPDKIAKLMQVVLASKRQDTPHVNAFAEHVLSFMETHPADILAR
jgi:hypothetical protein